MGELPAEAAANARLFAASYDLFWFVAGIAQSDPVFAKGHEKERIVEARRLIAQVLG